MLYPAELQAQSHRPEMEGLTGFEPANTRFADVRVIPVFATAPTAGTAVLSSAAAYAPPASRGSSHCGSLAGDTRNGIRLCRRTSASCILRIVSPDPPRSFAPPAPEHQQNPPGARAFLAHVCHLLGYTGRPPVVNPSYSFPYHVSATGLEPATFSSGG